MDHHGSGFVSSPWAAVLGHHAMAATAGADAGFAAAAAAAHVQNVAVAAQHHHHHSHHQIAAAAHHTHHHAHTHPHSSHHHHHHHHPHPHHLNPSGMPMDLHVPQGFPYYRYREDALCWGDRKSMEEIGAAQSSVNASTVRKFQEENKQIAEKLRHLGDMDGYR